MGLTPTRAPMAPPLLAILLSPQLRRHRPAFVAHPLRSSGKMSDGSSAANKGTWLSFLKSIATFTGDLSTLTAPSFILSGTSILEYSSYWGEHPELLCDIAEARDAESRMVAVVRWYASTLKPSFSARHESTGGEKKPLNPVLGETFRGSWKSSYGETTLVAEQVSHHPPISAYCMRSPNGVVLQGHNGQKSGFSGRTIVVKQMGYAVLTVPVKGQTETYLITLPQLTLEGLWYGSPYAELAEKSYIVSTSGWVAVNEYSGKGWVSGKKNTLSTKIYEPASTLDGNGKFVVEGQWIDRLAIRQSATEAVRETLLDTTSMTRVPITHHATDEPYESRRLWSGVATALKNADYETASKLKSVIEQSQRDLRKEEKAEGRTWQRKLFSWKQQNEPVVERLMEIVGHKAPEGYWCYIGPQ